MANTFQKWRLIEALTLDHPDQPFEAEVRNGQRDCRLDHFGTQNSQIGPRSREDKERCAAMMK
ncbi:MAG: hypothetical protein M0Z84_02925 [Gammaproteobacteria bacterium]|nr:hypothetical protein [Gammaproteobacteria bacterium]